MLRFYYESDGEIRNKSHYVVDRFADPLSDTRRTDVANKREGINLAKQWNNNSPWPIWDCIAADKEKKS